MIHDPRCERSKAKRCRCDCRGTQHGTATTRDPSDLKQLLERIAGELDDYLRAEDPAVRQAAVARQAVEDVEGHVTGMLGYSPRAAAHAIAATRRTQP